MEFPGIVGGPWDRYIVPGSAGVPPASSRSGHEARALVCTVRYTRLDAAVAAAYGWPACRDGRGAGRPSDLADEAILERLLALNQAAVC